MFADGLNIFFFLISILGVEINDIVFIKGRLGDLLIIISSFLISLSLVVLDVIGIRLVKEFCNSCSNNESFFGLIFSGGGVNGGEGNKFGETLGALKLFSSSIYDGILNSGLTGAVLLRII